MEFKEIISRGRLALTEGSIIELLKRSEKADLHPELLNATLLYDTPGRSLLENIWNDYLDVAAKHSLPMLILTPTWRANRANVAPNPKYTNINSESVNLLLNIASTRAQKENIYIGGLMGPKGDAYDPEDAPEAPEAESFHSWQAEILARSGTDFLIASTLPARSEALGLARAMAKTGKDYIISFVVLDSGFLPDGNKLAEAIEHIDANCDRPPLRYMINCVHPDNALRALANNPIASSSRLAGLQANASPLQPSVLDNSEKLHTSDPDKWADSMMKLCDCGLNILGGCCGTDPEFIEKLAMRIRSRC